VSDFPTNAESIAELCRKYPGLRPEDVCPANPTYCCVTCGVDCKWVGDYTRACGEYVPCSIETWAARYNFKEPI